jgi:hypothetical protein
MSTLPPTEDAAPAAAWQRLAAGFGKIRHIRPPFVSTATAKAAEKPADPHVATSSSSFPLLHVKFVDPAAAGRAAFRGSSSGATTPSPPNGSTAPVSAEAGLYDKLAHIFWQDYQSTVQNLTYPDVRSKAQNRIDHVRVACSPMESVVLLEESPKNPADWHRMPACHVYLVSCQSLEDYRQKVAPSLQAFVSQLTDQRARPYVVVYCPATTEDSDSAASSSTASTASAQSVGSVLAQRPVARASVALANRIRQRMAAASASAAATTDEADDAPALVTEDNGAATLKHLTRTERDVYRRLQADFGYAAQQQVCLLSLPALEAASTVAWKKTEWTAFQQCLAAALARGFTEQCQKYDGVLRQMDAQRGQGGTLDVSTFFLVKESWAFLFAQMNLPAEALLQYKEVRVVLPDLRTDALTKVVEDDILSGIAGTETRVAASDLWSELASLVQTGDLDGFRRELAVVPVLDAVAPALEDYLYVRETDLLFQMADPVEVLLKSLAYLTAMVDFRLEQADPADPPQQIEEWAFSFCWDLKEASQSYLSLVAVLDVDDEGVTRRPILENFARTLCDILDYARLRLLRLAKAHDKFGLVVPSLSTDLQSTWEAWNPWSAQEHEEASSSPDSDGRETPNGHDANSFLQDAFASQDAFQDCYLEVMKVAIAYNSLAGRHRSAARLRMEAVEIYMQRGDTKAAAETLAAIAAVYDRDQWLACNFLLLFRLAGFQRRISPPADYLRTLFRCFSAGTKDVAPVKAMEALQADLEAVVETDAVQGLSLESSPVFSPQLGLPDSNSRGTSDRKLVRKVYTVGDEATIVLSLSSFLCNTIEDISITVDLVPYQIYVSATEDDLPINASDVVRVLTMDFEVALSPGENQFAFRWVPLSSGQFIASSIHVEWKGIQFSYSAKDVPQPMVRIDVLPAEPDQSMKVTPLFLLPGHEQPLRVEFSAGLDEVESGLVQFVCSPGLLLLPPGDDAGERWTSSAAVPLPSCARGETTVLTASVKCVDSDEVDSSSPLVHVKISTQYRALPAGVPESELVKDKLAGSLFLTHDMDQEVPTLSASSLTVKDVYLASHVIGQTLLSVTLKCHTPVPFIIRRWNLQLPSYLTLHEKGDWNAAIADMAVLTGDTIHFGFLCDSHVAEWQSTTATLVVDMENPAGFVFHESLALRLRRTALPRVELPHHITCVPVQVHVSVREGLVGSPIQLAYEIDTALFAEWKGRVLYQVDVDSLDWIVSGSYRGVVDCSEAAVCRLEFLAIPVRPGVKDNYPILTLSLDGNDLERSYPLVVRLTGAPSFAVQAPVSQSSIVYPLFEV